MTSWVSINAVLLARRTAPRRSTPAQAFGTLGAKAALQALLITPKMVVLPTTAADELFLACGDHAEHARRAPS